MMLYFGCLHASNFSQNFVHMDWILRTHLWSAVLGQTASIIVDIMQWQAGNSLTVYLQLIDDLCSYI